MNKTKIEWCDSTWNPVTGCRHGCDYCYARRIAERFSTADKCHTYTGGHPVGKIHDLEKPASVTAEKRKAPYPFGFEPTLHRYKLDEPQGIKAPKNIFVCSMADLFGDWVPNEWIEQVFEACGKAPQHRYMFLTKNPARYMELSRLSLLPKKDNFWYGSTVTGPMQPFLHSGAYNTFLSIEPLMEQFGDTADKTVNFGVNWVIMGALTGPKSKQRQPKRAWIEEITQAAHRANIPVFMKDSLIPIMGEESMRREFPWPTRAQKTAGQDAGASAGQSAIMPAT